MRDHEQRGGEARRAVEVQPLRDARIEGDDDAGLRRNARLPIDQIGPYRDGLYVSAGHGSRGLTSAPLCAEAIAAAIAGEPSPLSRRLQRTLSPARFLVRRIIKGQLS